MIDNIGWQGIWKIRTVNRDTGKTKEEIIKNRILNVALDELLKVLQGLPTDMEIAYLALGTDDTPVADTQTELGAEIFRTPLQNSTKTGTGQLTSLFIVQDTEAVAHIKEIGIFGGSTASITPNSGLLISRILWDRNKTASEEIQFSRLDRMVRA